MASYLILGAGRFGRLALTRLLARDRKAHFHLVDHRAEALAGLQKLGKTVATTVAEAVNFLEIHLKDKVTWDWLIPMVPVHVAYHWLRRKALTAPKWEPAKVPEALESLGATAIRGPEGELYLSRGRHLCPDDCVEPEVCPVDGETREPPLYQQLAEFFLPGAKLLVVASLPLAPGVGGYAPARLLELAEAAPQLPVLTLVATACRCHGVVHGLKRQETE